MLRGWASILQIHPEPQGKGELRLKPIKGVGRSYLHHVLDLDGLGIRDLCVLENDLLVLAGPTMALDGPIRVFRWRDAFGARQDRCLDNRDLQRLFDIPTGPRVDHAEGMALFKRSEGSAPRLLVVYDSPAQGRLHSGRYFEADLFKI